MAEHTESQRAWLGDKIRHFNRVHVAMAVAVEDGLITPVLFDADRLSLWEISEKARDLAKRARERKLTPEEYTGATFTVSNLGMFGIDQFTAIINPPEAGILAIGGVEDRPVVVDGQLGLQRMRVTIVRPPRVDARKSQVPAYGQTYMIPLSRYLNYELQLELPVPLPVKLPATASVTPGARFIANL